jgi:putative salt-induced outer membrane protein
MIPGKTGTEYLERGGNIMNRGAVVLAVWILLASASIAGAEEPSKNGKAWSEQAELSFVNTTGNTKTTSLAGKNLLAYKFTPRTVGSWKIGALYSKDSGRTTAENYATELRLDWLYTERIYTYVLAGWNKNRFAGIDQRYYGGGGMGYKFLLGPKHFLVGEAGLNYTMEDYIDGSDSDFLTGRAFAKYEYAITKKNRFSQSLEYLYDFSDSAHYKLNSETALVASLTDIFSLKAGYTVRYDHKPVPAGLKQTDTLLSAALVANF